MVFWLLSRVGLTEPSPVLAECCGPRSRLSLCVFVCAVYYVRSISPLARVCSYADEPERTTGACVFYGYTTLAYDLLQRQINIAPVKRLLSPQK